VTAPVGVEPPEGKTTAVSVALPPAKAGEGAAVRVVVVVAAPIVTLAADDTELLSLPDPP
jgi:hypothetical protein